MAFSELDNPGRERTPNDAAQMLHHVDWRPVQWRAADRPSGVVLVGGDADGLDSAVRDLAAAGVPYLAVEDPADIATIAEFNGLPADLGADAVVVVLPRRDDAPEASVDLVMRTLTQLQSRALSARLWVVTHGVHEGANLVHAPLWGLARVAAAEHPQLWGGVLDVTDGRLPLGALVSLHGHGVVVIRDGVALAARLAPAGPRIGSPDGVLAGRHLSHHGRHRRARPAHGAAPRRPRRPPPGTAVTVGSARSRLVERSRRGVTRRPRTRSARSRRWRIVA